MGQCGCGDFYPDFKLPGPDGILYAIQLYRGCHECHTPVGVIVSRLKGDEIETWDAQELPDLEFNEISESYHEALLPVVEPTVVAKHLDLEHDLIEVYRALRQRPSGP